MVEAALVEIFRTDSTEELDTTCALADVARLECAMTQETLATIPYNPAGMQLNWG